MRARYSAFVAASLDGLLARRDGSIDWLSIVEQPDEDYGYARFFESIDTVVVGKKTYEAALGYETWPYAGKRCIVMTHSELVPKHGEESHAGPPGALVDRLDAEEVKHVYVDGGSVIQQFVAAGLLSDVTISIVPILLGDGIRLFGETGGDLPLQLVASRSFDSGVVQLAYEIRSA